MLEPGGNFFIKGKTPPMDERHHIELVRMLREIRDRLDTLEKRVQ